MGHPLRETEPGTWSNGHLRFDRAERGWLIRLATSSDTAAPVGGVKWLGLWREYVFTTFAGYIFAHDCLRDIAEFCENANTRERSMDYAQKRADLVQRYSGGPAAAPGDEAKCQPDLHRVGEQLGLIAEGFTDWIESLHRTADAIYGPQPPQPAGDSSRPDHGAAVARIDDQVQRLAYLRDKLANAVSRFSNLV